ncbi:hypothetical protein FO520_25110 [Bacillus subtilis]
MKQHEAAQTTLAKQNAESHISRADDAGEAKCGISAAANAASPAKKWTGNRFNRGSEAIGGREGTITSTTNASRAETGVTGSNQ